MHNCHYGVNCCALTLMWSLDICKIPDCPDFQCCPALYDDHSFFESDWSRILVGWWPLCMHVYVRERIRGSMGSRSLCGVEQMWLHFEHKSSVTQAPVRVDFSLHLSSSPPPSFISLAHKVHMPIPRPECTHLQHSTRDQTLKRGPATLHSLNYGPLTEEVGNKFVAKTICLY